MGLLFSVITWSGPVLGLSGWLLEVPLLLWIGAVAATVNLFLNVASGAMRVPILPAAFILAGGLVGSPWYLGAALGLLGWTAIEAVSEVIPTRGFKR